MSEATAYRTYGEVHEISLEEILRAFPLGEEPPRLLLAWAEWMRDQPAGWLGDIQLGCHRRHSYLDAEQDFHLADIIKGGNYGASFWFHDAVDARAPVILQDDDGDVEVIPSFEAFLARLALGVHAFDDDDDDDDEDDDENDEDEEDADTDADHSVDATDGGVADPMVLDALGFHAASLSLPGDAAGIDDAERLRGFAREGRRRLGAWLLEQTGAPDLASLMNEGAAAPDFHAWLAAKEAESAPTPEERMAKAALRRVMTSAVVLVLWAGDSYTAVIGGDGAYMPPYRPAPDGQAIKPHLAVLREAAARRTPGLGLWHSAIVTHPRFGSAFGRRLDDRTVMERVQDQAMGRRSDADDVSDALTAAAEADGVVVSPNHHDLYPKELAATRALPARELLKDQQRFPREERRIEPWLKALLRS